MTTVELEHEKSLHLRDPQMSTVGRRVLENGAELIDRVGFDQMTFRLLAKEIASTEASLYRYFTSKEQLLLYLMDWYWKWVLYRIQEETRPVPGAEEKLRRCLVVLTSTSPLVDTSPVSAAVLQRIVNAEFEKQYWRRLHPETPDQFTSFHQLCKTIEGYVREIRPDYDFPRSLTQTLIMSAMHEQFRSRHAPWLTDSHGSDQLITYLQQLLFGTLRLNHD